MISIERKRSSSSASPLIKCPTSGTHSGTRATQGRIRSVCTLRKSTKGCLIQNTRTHIYVYIPRAAIRRKFDQERSVLSYEIESNQTSFDFSSIKIFYAHTTGWSSKFRFSGVVDYCQHIKPSSSSSTTPPSPPGQQSAFLSIRLDHIFHPEMLLSSLRQECARHHRVPIDQLRLESTWGGQHQHDPRSDRVDRADSCPGLIAHGLKLQGALFDGRVLRETQHDSPRSLCFFKKSKLNRVSFHH